MNDIIKIFVNIPQAKNIVNIKFSSPNKIIYTGTSIHSSTALIDRTESPIGVLNGINPAFTSLFPFIPETLKVYLNGLRLKIIDEYNTIGNSEITLTVSPGNSETILINYIKQN